MLRFFSVVVLTVLTVLRCFFLCTLIIILLSCLSGFALQVCTIDQQRKVERRLSCNYRRRHGVCLATTEALYICIDSFFFFLHSEPESSIS